MLAACSTLNEESLARTSESRSVQPWGEGAPEDAGCNQAAIASLVEELRRGEHGAVDHFLLIHDGLKVVDERFHPTAYETLIDQAGSSPRPIHDYSNPAWHPYKKGTELHTMQSVTKSVTSIGIGMAIAAGAIPGVRVPALTYLDGVEINNDPRWKELTLFDLLTMQSGIDWTPPAGSVGYTPEHPTLQMESCDHWVPYITARPMRTAPGTEFEYVDGASVLIGHILHQAVGERVDTYLKRRLFDPIGIKEWFWKTSPAGEADTEGGLYLTAQGLARIGVLFLNEGRWNGTQILPSEWITESTTPHVLNNGPNSPIAYGYQWWVREHENGKTRIFGAFGFGGQILFIDRETGTIAVFLGWDETKNAAPLFAKRILPALQ